MSRIAIILLLSLLPFFSAAAQPRRTVSGTVTDSGSGELVAGAAVMARSGCIFVAGCVSDGSGFYSLTLPEGEYGILCAFIGYAPVEQSVLLHGGDVSLPFSLQPQPTNIDAVVVTGGRGSVHYAQPGTVGLDVGELARVPVLFGERDILKSIQLLPGVKAEGDGACGFQVRGGTSSQNLVLLDEAPVINAGHMMGFFSTFNSDAVRDLTLYKAPMPARYGGRVASALDVKMKEGGSRGFAMDGGVGLISARLSLEGPIAKDRASFFIAGRRTYADAFLAFVDKFDGSKLNFYDLNAKFDCRLSDRDRISLSGYFGRDNLVMKRAMGLVWGNGTATLGWSSQAGRNLVSNLSAIFSRYRSTMSSFPTIEGSEKMSAALRQWSLKEELQWYPSAGHLVRFGVQSSLHRVVTGEMSLADAGGVFSRVAEVRRGWENALWASDDWNIGGRLSVHAGLRLEIFTALGGSPFYTLDGAGRIVATDRSHGRWDAVATYATPELRLSLNWMIDDRRSLKAAYGRMTQNLHSVSSSFISSPFDRYVPSSNIIRPETADCVSAGYARTFAGGMYELSAEGYYRSADGVLDYRDAATYSDAVEIETLLLAGRGRAYGLELLFRKTRGRLTGWIAYTLSRTENRIPGIDGGRWYTAGSDRTHDLSVVAMWSVSPRWQLSASWVFASGQAMSVPAGKYHVDDVGWIYYYACRNGSRAPAYHRLDVSAVYRLRSRRRWEHELSFGLCNAYNRYNPYMITYEESGGATEATQYSLFGIVPFISYDFKFR